MTQEALRKHVLRVLRVWRDWYLFAEDLLNGLQALFLLSPNPEWDTLFPEQLEVGASFLAEIPVESPRKSFIFIIYKKYFPDQSIPQKKNCF